MFYINDRDSDFLTLTPEAKGCQRNAFKILRKNDFQPITLLSQPKIINQISGKNRDISDPRYQKFCLSCTLKVRKSHQLYGSGAKCLYKVIAIPLQSLHIVIILDIDQTKIMTIIGAMGTQERNIYVMWGLGMVKEI